ncbi:MAG: Rid family hydrolase [Quadrisphaera sp.]
MSRATDEEAVADARHLVSMVVDFLAEGEWETVANLTSGQRLSADQLEARVRDLPFPLVRMPAGAVDEIEVEPAVPRPAKTHGKRQRRRFAAVAPLWTAAGKSRWVLELTVRELSGGFLEAQVDGLHPALEGAPGHLPRAAVVERAMKLERAVELKRATRAKKTARAGARKQDGRPRWKTRAAEAVGRVPVDGAGRALHSGDVVAQLQLCLDDVRSQLEREQLSLADIHEMAVRTSDFPAARAQAEVLGRWQREHGAWERTSFEVVDALEPLGAVVEVEVHATHYELVAGELPETTPNTPVPEHLRPALRAELDALARGDRPDHLYWVEEYGDDGATLVVQPEAIWDHRETDASQQDDGSWWVVLPLWTELECPSALSAEVENDPSGTVIIHTVHVM